MSVHIKLSIAIMAHPSRVAQVIRLLTQLRREATLIAPPRVAWDDTSSGCWPTARRAWRLISPGATHHLVLTEDVRLCRHAVAGMLGALTAQPNAPVCFYATRQIVDAARRRGDSWVVIGDGVWGPASCLPAAWIPTWLAWVYRHIDPAYKHDDSRLAMWLLKTRRPSWCTVPSLVEHDSPPSASLLHKGGAPRVARWYAGDDFDARAIDWTRGLDAPYRQPGSWSSDYRRVYRE